MAPHSRVILILVANYSCMNLCAVSLSLPNDSKNDPEHRKSLVVLEWFSASTFKPICRHLTKGT